MTRTVTRWPLVVAVLIVVAGGWVVYRAYVEPRATAWNLSTAAGDRTLQEMWLVGNDGRSDEAITAVSVADPGVQLVSSEHHTTLRAKHPARVTVHLRITDCAHPRVGPTPIRIRVTRWGLTRTITLVDAGNDYDDAFLACNRQHR